MFYCLLSYILLRCTRVPIHVNVLKYTVDHSNDTIHVTWFHRPDWFPKHFNNTPCTFRNCIITDDRSQLSKSRTVLFYHRHLSKIIPEMWNKQFDIFHTYLTDSDILRRQSVEKRSNPLERNYSLIYKQKTKLSAWLVSNCNAHSKRDEYAKELQQYIHIDVYGACGTNNSVC